TRRRFFNMTGAALLAGAAPQTLQAQTAEPPNTPISPPEVATAGRPQATEKFGPGVNDVPIIDAHIHLFDGTRPQGATYMGSAAYRSRSKTSLPGLYARLARPTGVVGAI